uniref:Uncharacterized protein n=1 Tax=Parascaris univalens TaxID=6257 RepID=A0A915ASD1_PARUN
HEINQSLVGSNLFSEAVVNREQHNIRTRFGSLCRDLGHMIKCIEPVTRNGCGEDAARMMLKFITVGFASFEQLYSQLGISDQLPNSCRQLLTLTLSGRTTERRTTSQRHSKFSSGVTRRIQHLSLSYVLLTVVYGSLVTFHIL